MKKQIAVVAAKSETVTSRGEVVDDEALIEALSTGKIAAGHALCHGDENRRELGGSAHYRKSAESAQP